MRWFVVGAFLVAALGARTASAAPINYGDFGPDYSPGITIYKSVTESSATDPLPPGRFGPPSIHGDTLDFDPKEFAAFASYGAADITDVQLNFGLMTPPLSGITSMTIEEGGDYTLFGAGTALTSVVAGISVSIDIFDVDGVPLATPISVFASNSISRDLVSDGPVVLAPWNNGLLVDFAAVLASNQIDYQWGISRAKVVIDDQLLALSQSESLAFIAKKDFRITTGVKLDDSFQIPEPTSVVMMACALAGFAVVYRRRLFRSSTA